MSWRCNGVFKGGGAKGIAYVGALEACERAEVEFNAVAGSSAGAITAALVACGFESSELRGLMGSALRTIDHPVGAFVRPGRSSLLASDNLRRWLEETLANRIRPGGYVEGDSPCTFAEVFARSSIGLYVVAMDLSSRQPVVFSHDLTAEMSVADAVVASSAIPVAFPPALVHVDRDVYRLVDGGAYANYPSFVFDDVSFRRYHGVADCTDTPTLGFILDESDAEDTPLWNGARATDVPRYSTDRGAAARELGPLGAVLNSPLLRWSLALLPLVFVVAVVLWLVRESERGYPLIGMLPERLDPLEDAGLMLIVLGAATIGVVGLVAAAVLARLGRDAFDVGVMGAVAAMGVGPSVPYWTGADSSANGHVAIRIRVPSSLGTLSFGASTRVVEEAIATGRRAAEVRLDEAFGRTGSPGEQSGEGADLASMAIPWPPPPTEPADHQFSPVERQPRRSGKALAWIRWRPLLRAAGIGLYVYLGGALVGLAAALGLSKLLSGSMLFGGFLLIVAGAAALGGAFFLAVRKSRRSVDPFPILGELSTPTLLATTAAGVIATVALLSFAFSQGRASIPAVAAFDITEATVEHVAGSGSQQSLWVSFADGFPTDEIDQLRVDHRGTAITPCDDPSVAETRELEEFASADRCVVFSRTDGGLEEGEVVAVLFDLDRGMALLEVDQWSVGFLGGPAIITVLSLEFLATSYHAARALRWRRREQTLLASPA